MASQHPDPDVSLLLSYVRARDVQCPACGYNLRALTHPQCPECGATLAIGVGVRESRWGIWVAIALPWLLNAGTGLFFAAYVLRWRQGISSRFLITVMSYVVCIGPAVLALIFRLRLVRMKRPVQITMVIAGWLFCIVAFAIGIYTIR